MTDSTSSLHPTPEQVQRDQTHPCPLPFPPYPWAKRSPCNLHAPEQALSPSPHQSIPNFFFCIWTQTVHSVCRGEAQLHRAAGTWTGDPGRQDLAFPELPSEAHPTIHPSECRRCGDNDYFLNITLFKQPCCGVWRNSGCFCIPGAAGAASLS